MSKHARHSELFIVDIFIALEKIREYTELFSEADAFRYSTIHWDATIRQLEILGEALNHLLAYEPFSALAPHYFRKIVNFRNVIVHEYFGIDEVEVWDVIEHKLPLLQADMSVILNTIDITVAVESVLAESRDQGVNRMLKRLIESS